MTTSYAESTAPHPAASQKSNLRVAWLFPSLARGSYWHPLFSQFSQQYSRTIIYTGEWTGFAAGFEDRFKIEVVGKTRIFHTTKTNSGYSRSYILPSFEIVPKLLAFRPEVIFTSAFSLWTLVALLFKLFLGSRVVVLFDGVSPGVDYLNSGIRVFPRRLMSKLIDAFIANSKAGKKYLIETVWASHSKVFVQPYLVPDLSALNAHRSKAERPSQQALAQPIFLFVGQIVSRKGIEFLLTACAQLKQKHGENFTLLIIGEGNDRPALEKLAQQQALENCVQWLGEVKYNQLGAYFEQSDVFVFPTLEDIWGMVVSEAMAFGKPVLCSKWAGATEIVANNDSGYIFDPYDVEQLAALMSRFIEQPELIDQMGNRAKELSANLTPQKAATFFCQLTATL